MRIDAAILTPLALLMGALIGGGASLLAAIYTQRIQNHLQRVAAEVAKRETVYADFVMAASDLLIKAYLHEGIQLDGEQQRLIGLINRMRLFAPPGVVDGADAVFGAIVDVALKPSIELRQLAKEAASRHDDRDPLVAFSQICRADLDAVAAWSDRIRQEPYPASSFRWGGVLRRLGARTRVSPVCATSSSIPHS